MQHRRLLPVIRRALVVLGLGAPIVLAAACERIGYYSITGSAAAGDDGGPGPSGPSNGATPQPGAVTRSQVLEGVVTCADVLYADVANAAGGLDAAVSAYASSPTPENEAAARAAWTTTMGLWQQAEILRFGPAGPTTLPEGEGLREYVYSWPLVSRCLVEQNIVSQKYAQSNFATSALVNTRGLAAAEYLLFYTGSDNACSPTASINSQGTWAALGADGLAARKRDYAAVVASDVASKAAAIRDGWLGNDGFGPVLAGAGGSGSPFDSDQAALNVVSDGLFYVEKEVKDLKLGLPLGKSDECTSGTCPEDIESQYALVSRDNIRNNLIGFQRVFDGCDAAADRGFDDLLRGVGSTELADRMSGDLAAAIAATDALPSGDLVALLATDKAAVDGLYTAIKKVTDALKTDFVTVLDLELPKSSEGDND